MSDRMWLPGSLSIGSDCFACGPDNERGLRVPYERVGEAIEAGFTLGPQYSGAPAFVHGGVIMTILDEAMAWATIALRARFAVTLTFTSTFTRPVLIDEPHTVQATCGELAEDGRTLIVTGVVRRGDGKVCTRAEATYYALTVSETAAASGLPQLPAEMLAFGFADADLA